MKINTILFILFTLVISTEIRDETTLGSVGNAENNYVNITETTKTTEENNENGSFIYRIIRETLYLLAVPLIFIFVIILVHLILKINVIYNNQIEKFIEYSGWIWCAIKIIYTIVVIVLVIIFI